MIAKSLMEYYGDMEVKPADQYVKRIDEDAVWYCEDSINDAVCMFCLTNEEGTDWCYMIDNLKYKSCYTSPYRKLVETYTEAAPKLKKNTLEQLSFLEKVKEKPKEKIKKLKVKPKPEAKDTPLEQLNLFDNA